MPRVGIAREVVTPPRGTDLAGYFNARHNVGAYDDLYVKVMLVEGAGGVTGFVVYDLCFLTLPLLAELKAEITKHHPDFAGRLIFSATHTHTGPYTGDFFGFAPDRDYLALLVHKTGLAVDRAAANLAPAEFEFTAWRDNPLAFVRRYKMKQGGVLTNPGKLNPDIVEPESEFDPLISLLAVRQNGLLAALFVNLANHTDTIGGNLVSADWSGRMEREIQYQLGYDPVVFTLLDASGDINHFDVGSDRDQTSYDEALRLGREYGKMVAGRLPELAPLNSEEIRFKTVPFEVRYRDIADEEAAKAREILARNPADAAGEDMTSEGLATGDGPVARFFAEQLLRYQKNCSGTGRTFELCAVKLDRDLAAVTIPGEAFNGIARAIRAGSPFANTLIITLGQGECGYIAMPECFSAGGYEVLPVEGGSPREDTAPRLTAAALALLKELR